MSVDPPLEGEDVPVGPGIALATVASACGVTTKEVEMLNPELRASRTPPSGAVGSTAGQDDWAVKVPTGKAGGWRETLTPAQAVSSEATTTRSFVSRAGHKLEAALVAFALDVTGRISADLGANVGLFAASCLERWPDAQIVAVEPDPENLQLLERMAAEEQFGYRPGVDAAAEPIVGGYSQQDHEEFIR